MKDTLEKQLEDLNKKKEDEHKVNPEQHNYSFISNIYRDKKSAYDNADLLLQGVITESADLMTFHQVVLSHYFSLYFYHLYY